MTTRHRNAATGADGSPHLLFAIALLAISLAALVGVAAILGKLPRGTQVGAAQLAGLLGCAVALAGILRLVQLAWDKHADEPAACAIPVALVLAGGVLAGGGWGAAFGLALLACTAIYLRYRGDRGPDPDASESGE